MQNNKKTFVEKVFFHVIRMFNPDIQYNSVQKHL